jgi:endo-1,4-beta-xylanase
MPVRRLPLLVLPLLWGLLGCDPDASAVSSSTGGSVSTGGETGTGGTTETGGAQATGGDTETGGDNTATGGAQTAGETATGGKTNTGGTPRYRDAGASPDTSLPPDTSRPDTTTAATGGNTPPTGGATTLPKFVGNIDTRGSIRSDFNKYWNQFSPENAGKWGSVQSREGSFNWKSLDAMYKYCTDNNIIFKHHVFVWGAQQPNWVNNGNGETAVKAWMKAYCERYPKVAMIDVVNEPPPHTTPAYKDGIGGNGASGWDWIANSFKWAREYCPNAILLLNDYNTIEYANQRDSFINIVKKIKAVGAPIDAVGVQAHGLANASASSAKGHIDTIASQTGLPVYVTEFDIGIADDNRQKSKIQEHFTMFWNNTNVKGITFWGYINGSTWVANTGLIQSNGTTFRPSMTWLMDFIGK